MNLELYAPDRHRRAHLRRDRRPRPL